MRSYLLAAVAAAALATPAVARDNSWYVGIEGGALLAEDTDLDLDSDIAEIEDAFSIDYKTPGFDVDLISGYDFGMFRLEAELAYKRMKIDDLTFNSQLFPFTDTALRNLCVGPPANPAFCTASLTTAGTFSELIEGEDLSDKARVISAMGNALLDFGPDDGMSGYVGGGVGVARVKLLDQKDSGFAWQAIAGIRVPVSPLLDLGLKYRFFNTKADFDSSFLGEPIELDGRVRTHSLLASLVYNFAPPPPPPPPPPPAAEPPPPPPPPPVEEAPPPPPPAPERG